MKPSLSPAADPAPRREPPLVSVIVPAFNAARWIERTLRSAMEQSWERLEILVIDDGSTDDTVARVEALAAEDPRIRLIRQENAGVAVARNRGLKEARGVYVAPLDSDDLWLPGNLETQVEALEAAGPEAGFSFVRSAWIDENDRVIGRALEGPAPAVGFREILRRNPVGNGSAAVYRRSVLLDVGGWDPDLKSAEDWKLNLSVAAGHAVLALPQALVRYRILPSSKSHRFEISVRANTRVVSHARRMRPDVPVREYWNARTQAMLWMLPRAAKAGRWGWAAKIAATAYLLNPLWFTLPEAREFLLRAVRTAAVKPHRLRPRLARSA